MLLPCLRDKMISLWDHFRSIISSLDFYLLVCVSAAFSTQPTDLPVTYTMLPDLVNSTDIFKNVSSYKNTTKLHEVTTQWSAGDHPQ